MSQCIPSANTLPSRVVHTLIRHLTLHTNVSCSFMNLAKHIRRRSSLTSHMHRNNYPTKTVPTAHCNSPFSLLVPPVMQQEQETPRTGSWLLFTTNVHYQCLFSVFTNSRLQKTQNCCICARYTRRLKAYVTVNVDQYSPADPSR